MTEERVLRLGIDPRGAEQGARRFRRATDEASGSAKVLAGTVRALAAAYATLKVGEQVRDATMMAARYETLGVVTEAVGRNAGYTADQMRRFEKALRDGGIAAIESREALARMTQANVDLSRSTELARVAQNAAVIANTNSSDAFNRLVYGIQSAQVETLRTMGLNVNFESSYKRLAEQLGKNATDLTELEKVQARVNVVLEAGDQITGTYEASMETAGKQLGSMKRQVDDLMVSLGNKALPLFTEQVFALSDALKTAQMWADAWGGPTLQAQGIIGGLDGIEDVDALRQRYEMFADMFPAVQSAAGRSIDEINASFKELGITGQDLGHILAAIEERIAALTDPGRGPAEAEVFLARSLETSVQNLDLLTAASDRLSESAAEIRLDIFLATSTEEAERLEGELAAVLDTLERINAERARQILTPGFGITPSTMDPGGFTGSRAVGLRSKPGIGEGIGNARFNINQLTNPNAIAMAGSLEELGTEMGDVAAITRVASPLLGEFGGSMSSIAAGLATGGMVGIGSAIVGGIGVIMEGLLDGGVQAQKAAQQWQRALDDFANAFAPATEWERGMQQAERDFIQIAEQGAAAIGWEGAIGSVDEARAFVERWRGTAKFGVDELVATLDEALSAYDQHVAGLGDLLREQESVFEEDLSVRMLRAQGLDDQADALAFAIAQERELAKAREMYGADSEIVAYLEQVQAAEAAAEAMKDLNDAMLSVTTALNAPQGLNMALLTYNASLQGERRFRDGAVTGTGTIDTDNRRTRSGDTYNVEINVTGTTDSRTTARMVMEEFQRLAMTGGGDPLETTRF